jgi:hypothetical protein
MSNQDDLPAENKLGWWKHTGDSSVSYAGGINGNTIPDDSEEIPEFPNLVIPMMAILCMSLIFGKNK